MLFWNTEIKIFNINIDSRSSVKFTNFISKFISQLKYIETICIFDRNMKNFDKNFKKPGEMLA